MSPVLTSVISLLFISKAWSVDEAFLQTWYIGCFVDVKYEDDNNRHDMSELVISYLEGGIEEPCINACRKRGFKFAGARVFQCYCSNDFGYLGKAPDMYCVTKDCGAKSICGGEFYNAAYRTCPFGTFGDSCQYFCHCKDKEEPCEVLTGTCPAGGCEAEYITQSCSIRDQCVTQFGCFDGGTCTVDRFDINYMCLCPPEFRGAHCEESCPIGLWGEACENICKCANKRRCTIATGICPSECQPSFFGEHCEKYDPCSETPCKNNGICYYDEGSYNCKCVGTFFGRHCEYDSSANGPKSKFAFLEVQVKRLAKGKVRSTYTYHYIGCFRDKGIDRDLDGHLWVDADMGPGACSRRCRHKGFTFAGIQAGTDCRCGNSFGKHGIVPDGNCDIVCANEPLKKCGADDMNSIYSVCPAGSYEPSCKAICNCLANMPCDLMTGACTNQLCKSGWTGGTCNEVVVYNKWRFYTSSLITALGAYAILVAVLTIWIGQQWMKKKRSFTTARIKLNQKFTETIV